FNPTTLIRYQLAESEKVELNIYNLLGERIAKLVNERQNPGNYVIQFDASDLSSGIYFYHLKTESFNQVKKMLVIR
ncbi:T9SS type A sorting domain-containing protein, partial [candidate division KSB1 bacterium]|nr:T9SS type A sorting domain-containing protein [candidate division KSB1 bacterium]